MEVFTQEVIVSERRFQYEAEVKSNPQNYDFWFDYIRLEESAGDHDRVSKCTWAPSTDHRNCSTLHSRAGLSISPYIRPKVVFRICAHVSRTARDPLKPLAYAADKGRVRKGCQQCSPSKREEVLAEVHLPVD